ncbi:MAG: helix-turn-helix domain-containing protein [Lachnospiraceae bacterium]|nr:helix-turn-helix domain-containing protein [Lachnospiraceae bacterium]
MAAELNFEAFHVNLRNLVAARGITYKQLANEIGILPSTLSRYVGEKRYPDLTNIVKIADYFNVSIDWLIGFNGESFDVLPQEVQDVTEMYMIASPADRDIVQAVLNKYRASMEQGKETRTPRNRGREFRDASPKIIEMKAK